MLEGLTRRNKCTNLLPIELAGNDDRLGPYMVSFRVLLCVGRNVRLLAPEVVSTPLYADVEGYGHSFSSQMIANNATQARKGRKEVGRKNTTNERLV